MTAPAPLQLVKPARAFVDGFVQAVEAGWSPSTIDPEAGRRAVAKIQSDPDAFLASLEDHKALGDPITGPNGKVWPRIPGFARWLWNGDFCGSISLRWVTGTSALPSHVSGHIGYSVVPGKRRLGYATRALALLLPLARNEGLDKVDITTNADNLASQKVITANGGVLIDAAHQTEHYGPRLLYRIDLTG